MFSLQLIKFLDDGSMKVVLHGVKNDYSREGLEIPVVAATEKKVCPVRTLKHLLYRTSLCNSDPKRPVNYPYSGLSSSSIAKILCKAIELAGLSGNGYSAKSFRPTGATVAIRQGVNPDMVRKIGHWKNQQCFYVHTVPDTDMTDVVWNS